MGGWETAILLNYWGNVSRYFLGIRENSNYSSPRMYALPPKLIMLPMVAVVLSGQASAVLTTSSDVSVYVTPSSAPNSSSGSTGYAGYLSNLRASATASGFTDIGNRTTDPTSRVSAGTTISLSDAYVSNYQSWMGEAHPSGLISNEYGNRVQFNVIALAVGDGITLSLSGVTFGISSTAIPSIASIYAPIGSYSASVYSTRNIGVTSFGADGVLGGGDDTYLMSGEAGTTPVLALILRGNGFAYDGTTQYNGDEWAPGTTDEQKFASFQNDFLTENPYGVDLTTSYTINYNGGAGSIVASGGTVTIVPEPSSALVLGLVSSIAWLRRRR